MGKRHAYYEQMKSMMPYGITGLERVNQNNTIEEEIKERQETKPSMQTPPKNFKTNYYQINLN